MAVPNDWSAIYVILNNSGQIEGVHDVRMVCPVCRNASTFTVRSVEHDIKGGKTIVYMLLQCNYATCRKTSFVVTTLNTNVQKNSADDPFYIYPSKTIEAPH